MEPNRVPSLKPRLRNLLAIALLDGVWVLRPVDFQRYDNSRMISLPSILLQRDVILRVAARYGASNVRLFGSVAQGTASASSDLDLLVTLEERRSLIDRIALQQDLEDQLGCRVDVVNERALDPTIRDGVLAEARPL